MQKKDGFEEIPLLDRFICGKKWLMGTHLYFPLISIFLSSLFWTGILLKIKDIPKRLMDWKLPIKNAGEMRLDSPFITLFSRFKGILLKVSSDQCWLHPLKTNTQRLRLQIKKSGNISAHFLKESSLSWVLDDLFSRSRFHRLVFYLSFETKGRSQGYAF